MRALALLVLFSSTAFAQVFPVATYASSAPDVMVDAALSQVTSTYVKRSGDTMSGALKFNTSLRDPLVLSQSTTAIVGMCFNRTCTNEIVATNSTNALGFNGFTSMVGAQSMAFSYFSSNRNAAPAFEATGTGYLKLAGVATGSLPTCNAAAEGSLHYDLTADKFKICNAAGTGWETVQTTAGDVGVGWAPWSNFQPDVPAADGAYGATTVFLGRVRTGSVAGGTGVVNCQYGTAGVNGGGTNKVKVAIYDIDSAADVCTCELDGDCTNGRTTVASCGCAGSFVSNHDVAMYLHGDTDCGTNPGRIYCTVLTEN